MKSIFEETQRQELIDRIKTLDAGDAAQWGKMNVFQMIRHCSLWDEWVLGQKNPRYKQEFIGYLFGKIALRRMIKDDGPFDKNVPTSSFLVIKEKDGDLTQLKTNWVRLIEGYAGYSNPGFIHDFFGKMTLEQIGVLAYKHTDHHLRQFGK